MLACSRSHASAGVPSGNTTGDGDVAMPGSLILSPLYSFVLFPILPIMVVPPREVFLLQRCQGVLGKTPLHLASAHGHISATKLLLRPEVLLMQMLGEKC